MRQEQVQMIPDDYGEHQYRFYSQGDEKGQTRPELLPIYCIISAWIKPGSPDRC
jgi:hypothetical protein